MCEQPATTASPTEERQVAADGGGRSHRARVNFMPGGMSQRRGWAGGVLGATLASEQAEQRA